ncbi:MAG TPA: hypothetical protein VM164_12915 [Burkholderiales bacterium]|nr:hypothetical protein [Burkholderiales bacterium]
MRGTPALITLLLFGIVPAWADDAMLTQVNGEVSVAGKSGSRAAVPFLKVANGDKLSLGKNARVQMVYFGNGRQEIWKGEGQIDVGSLEGRSGSMKPDVAQLPPLVINQLAKTPAPGQQGRTGMVMVRSLGDPDALEHLEKQYGELRGRAVADDTTPEVFLLSGLLDLKEYDKARKVLADLKTKQLTTPAFEPLVDHFTPVLERASAR